jgi:hypothetical protein
MPSRRSYRLAFGSEQALLPATQSKNSRVLDPPLAPPSTLLAWTLGRGSVVSIYSWHPTELRALSEILSSGEFGLQWCSIAFFLLVRSLTRSAFILSSLQLSVRYAGVVVVSFETKVFLAVPPVLLTVLGLAAAPPSWVIVTEPPFRCRHRLRHLLQGYERVRSASFQYVMHNSSPEGQL